MVEFYFKMKKINLSYLYIIIKKKKGSIKVWDTLSGRPILQFKQNFGVVLDSMSLNENTICTCHYNDNNIRIWNVDSGELIQSIQVKDNVLSLGKFIYWLS